MLKVFKKKSIKFKVVPSDCNYDVFSFLVIALPPLLLESSTYVGCCLSFADIEQIRLYLYVLAFMITPSKKYL